MRRKKRATLLLLLLLVPEAAFAQSTIEDILFITKDLLDIIVPIFITLAIVYFFWGLGKFIINAGNPDARSEGAGIMLWGIIALFVMVSVWGLVSVIQVTFGTLDTAQTTQLDFAPFVPTPF